MNAAHVLKQRIAKSFCFRPPTDLGQESQIPHCTELNGSKMPGGDGRYWNSCYYSCACGQIFFCFKRHANEANGSTQSKIDPFASITVITAIDWYITRDKIIYVRN